VDQGRQLHDLVGAGGASDYPTRCRLIVGEVTRQHAALADPSHPSSGAEEWGWLEAELAAAAALQGTVASRLRARAAGGAPSDLRLWTWQHIGIPRDRRWTRGAESRSMWSFLLSPLPADDDELWWLASSNGLEADHLRALLDPVAVSGRPVEVAP